jgi:hypothetical protein
VEIYLAGKISQKSNERKYILFRSLFITNRL